MLALAGISHKTAPIEVRERLAFSGGDLAELLPALRDRFGPAIVLSTCNRTEVYLDNGDGGVDVDALTSFMAGLFGRSSCVASGHFYSLRSDAAVRHLYRVTAGLESMILGESQILGQVRQALQIAQHAGVTDPLLVRLFQTALAAGRRVRTGAGLAGSAASVSGAAVELARRSLGDLSGSSVLVISAGEVAKLAAWSLSRSGAGRIVIAGRTLSRATRLAEELGATAVSLQALPQALVEADIVVSSTGSRDFCIERTMVASTMARRPERRLLLMDLAVPRDIDPSARGIAGVTLHDIDSLQPLINQRSGNSNDTTEQMEAALEEDVIRFMGWWRTRWVVPTIAALRGRAEDIRRAELAKTFGRLPNLSPEERGRIDAMTSAIVKKFLHQPIMSLKDPDAPPAHLDALRELFALHASIEQ